MHVCGQGGIWEISVPSIQFGDEHKTALKNKGCFKKKSKKKKSVYIYIFLPQKFHEADTKGVELASERNSRGLGLGVSLVRKHLCKEVKQAAQIEYRHFLPICN